MTAETEKRELPLGVGRITKGWILFIGFSVVVLAFGIYAYSVQFTQGEIATGMRDLGTMGGATWGLYITMAIYFVGVSFAGITVAAFIRLTAQAYLKPLARMAEVLTVVALILGALSIMADLGQPIRGIVNLFMYARPQSPFFGTVTLVLTGYLYASVVYLYLDGRRDAGILARVPSRLRWFHRLWAAGYKDTPKEKERHKRTNFWMSVAVIPLLVIAHSTLGFVFGLQVGRPGWYSALQAPAFVILAGISGLGHLIIFAAIVRTRLNQRKRLNMDVFSWMGKFMLALLLIYVYFLIVDHLTSTFTAREEELRVFNAVLWGEYAWIYWLSVATLAIPLLILARQFFAKKWNIGWLVVSGFLVNVAAIGKRYLIVVPSQTYGGLLPYAVGSYSPTWVEYGTIIGIFALGAILFGIFAKTFPIMHLQEKHEGGA
ncbi:MAG: polysulfide reductase NrfD [Candidatus Thermoplasmatota archaeon]|nr:polysulfide reductase NrfD [Candidatus Thermoplasmatota archaeon]